jgi:uncharacterized protein YukE
MVKHMADEYYERYKHLSHQELYRMLRAGSVRQVLEVADAWGTIADTLGALDAALTQDLHRLGRSWTGHASHEFAARLTVVANYARTLAAEASAFRKGLTAMAGALGDAQRRAESPELAAGETGALSGVLGADLGWALSPAEAKQAKERMVWLVAKLAAEYAVVAHTAWPAELPRPPVLLPGAEVLTSRGKTRPKVPPVVAGTVLSGAVVAAAAVEVSAGAAIPARMLAGSASLQSEQLRATASPAGNAAEAMENSRTSGTTPAAASAQAMPMAPVGLAGAGASPGAPMLGGQPASLAHQAWQSADNVDWSDQEGDAPPSVLGT